METELSQCRLIRADHDCAGGIAQLYIRKCSISKAVRCLYKGPRPSVSPLSQFSEHALAVNRFGSKADIRRSHFDVRFVPIADIVPHSITLLADEPWEPCVQFWGLIAGNEILNTDP